MSKLLQRIKTARTKSSTGVSKVYFSPQADDEYERRRRGSLDAGNGNRGAPTPHAVADGEAQHAPSTPSSSGTKFDTWFAPRAHSVASAKEGLEYSNADEAVGTPEKRKSSRFGSLFKDNRTPRSSASSTRNNSRANLHRSGDTTLVLLSADMDLLPIEENEKDQNAATQTPIGNGAECMETAFGSGESQDSQLAVFEVLDFSKPLMGQDKAPMPSPIGDASGGRLFRFAPVEGGTSTANRSLNASATSFNTARTSASRADIAAHSTSDDNDDDDWVPAEMLEEKENQSHDGDSQTQNGSLRTDLNAIAQSLEQAVLSAPANPTPDSIADLKLLLLRSVEYNYASSLDQGGLPVDERICIEQKLHEARSAMESLQAL